MARVPVISKALAAEKTSQASEALECVHITPEDVTFRPSDAQRMVRASFMQRWRETPTGDLSGVTAMTAVQLTGDKRIQSWWSRPLFRDWFLGQDEYINTARLLAEKAQGILVALLDDELTPPMLRAKLALEVIKNYDAMQRTVQTTQKFLDADIQNADPEQLRQLIDSMESRK